MRKIFVNVNRQIRSGWKIAMVLAASMISGVVLVIIPTIVMIVSVVFPEMNGRFSSSRYMDLIQTKIVGNSFYNLICNIISALCVIFAVFFAVRLFDKKKLKDIGFSSIRRNYGDLLLGLLLGMVSISIVFAALLMTGDTELLKGYSAPVFSFPVISGFIMFVFVGINEELFSRGYCMFVLKQTGTGWVPILGSSIIFSLMHSLNPNVSLLGFVNIFLVGILFALMAIKTGNLWMPIGYHITWNFFQGNVYGLPVSGMPTDSILRTGMVRDSVLNGGRFGPEAGLAVTVLLVASIVIIWLYKGRSNSTVLQKAKA